MSERMRELLREAGAAASDEACRPWVEEHLRAAVQPPAPQRWWVWAGALAAAAALPLLVARMPNRPLPRVTPAEVYTDFYALDSAATAGIPDGMVLRVRVPRAMMANFGLPVTEERLGQRVEADVLVGNDGAARAIRFVRRFE